MPWERWERKTIKEIKIQGNSILLFSVLYLWLAFLDVMLKCGDCNIV